jgi:hypothetical protein
MRFLLRQLYSSKIFPVLVRWVALFIKKKKKSTCTCQNSNPVFRPIVTSSHLLAEPSLFLTYFSLWQKLRMGIHLHGIIKHKGINVTTNLKSTYCRLWNRRWDWIPCRKIREIALHVHKQNCFEHFSVPGETTPLPDSGPTQPHNRRCLFGVKVPGGRS